MNDVPVQRFRRVEDMPAAAPLPPGPERARRLRSLWGGWSRVLAPLDFAGVRLYRDMEEANRDREEAVARRSRRLLAARGVEGVRPVTASASASAAGDR